jgi:hypothetical protein
MDLLLSVTQDAKGYWNVIAGLERNDDLTTYQKWLIQKKSQYLYCVLGFTKKLMPSTKNWDKCCQEAINVLSLSGVSIAGCSRSVRNWYLDFVKN